ncbi:MAG TPA: glycosyltransferase [Candidatus Limnocylindrales bacterium]|nr:glycosyltransferase [Candidatus Limnocylindrales bacterium]
MIAFHYPPFRGSSGIQRTLKFCRYLPDYNWQPLVLTAHPRAYSQIGKDQLGEIPENAVVKRVFALDAARHLAIRGSYPRWLALPDRWVSWWLGAVPVGLGLIYKYRPRVIWSTFPIATAHLIGWTLHRLTGIPWIADFRDSMTEDNYPPDFATWRAYRWIERYTVKHCARAVFTTPGTLRLYVERYPEIPQDRWAIIANGYDEENFIAAEKLVVNQPSSNHRITLVHSGLLYPWERDPGAFFAALAELRQAGKISSSNLRIILRASGYEDYYRQNLRKMGIEDLVFLEPPLSYQDALVEMLRADGLLIFQASNCNHQIPAKIYEYLRARRPIFAMTDPAGDTAQVLKSVGINTIVPLDSKEQIMQGLLDFLTQVRQHHAPIISIKEIQSHSRESRTRELVKLLDSFLR